MSLTRANVEAILIRRLGKLLTEAEMDGDTTNGTNLDLNDPIGWAVRQCGGSVANPVNVAASDVATIGAGDIDQLFDLAEYRTLQNISGNLASVDIRVGSRQESFNQLAERVEARITRKKAQLQQEYSFGLGTLEAGVINLDFQQKTDNADYE